MTEEQKELLKEKLKNLFEEKINALTNKFQEDINMVETLKYSYFDNVVLPFREMEEKSKVVKEKAKEEPKDKAKKEKVEDAKKEKNISRLSKTPLKPNKKKDLGFKEKTEALPKKTKVFSGRKNQTQKTENEHQSTVQNERSKKKSLTTIDAKNKNSGIKRSKTPFVSKRGKNNEEEKAPTQRAKKVNATAVKTVTSKRFTGKGKAAPKKGKPEKGKKEKKKIEKQEEPKEETKEEIKEEKKEIILKDKSVNAIPDELKDKNNLINIYLALKGKYLSNKEQFKLILYNPTIYKCFGSNVKFLLDDKKKELQSKITELESFLNNYGDLQTYITKEFSPSKIAQNSLNFVKRDEIEKIIKSGKIEPEINDIFKLLFYIFDIPFDSNLENENLLNYFIAEVMDKNGIKELKSIASKYISENKDLNISKEKYDNINNIVNSSPKVISSVDIAKIYRSISYCTLLIKEVHEYINLKTLDDVPYYELKYKNKLLQEYKDKIASFENNGVVPKTEEEPKVEESSAPKENNE